jgi:hypothetical protein
VGWLLFAAARQIEWTEVAASVRALPASVLFTAAALGAASHTLFSCFDLLGRRYTGHALPTRLVMLVNAISYAFNLNLGSLVGGVAFRYRLYSRLGLRTGTITRILTLSMLTNWLGYVLLAGMAFAVWPLELPVAWQMESDGLRVLGLVLLAAGATYLITCVLKPGHTWRNLKWLRGHDITVPNWRMASLQVLMSCTNWMLMATMVWVLLQGRIAWHSVLAVLLIGAVAGVVTHVPAGLGVLEAVFIALLGDQLPPAELLGALLAYRALYYLVPLGVASVAYAVTEARARKQKPGGAWRKNAPRPAG